MLTRADFDQWFNDYAARWPAVRDYANRQPTLEALLDNWHASLAAFDLGDLEALTAAIVAGDFDPVENCKLGTFSNEIRRMGREMRYRRRDAEHQQEQRKAVEAKPFNPLNTGSMVSMYHACCAVYELLPGADQDVIDAAICLADDHSAYERDRSLLALEGAGLTWDQVREVAERLRRAGGRPLVPSAKEVESEVV
jgi:hypothetical protein